MPAVIIERPECKEEMWKALKRHIIRSRQKKKEELAVEEAEERQRKLNEQQFQRERMTLGETRNKVMNLEATLKKLKDDKHQLFLQLKKVLNEESANRLRRAKIDMGHLEQQQANQQINMDPLRNVNLLQSFAVPMRSHKVGQPMDRQGDTVIFHQPDEDSRRGHGEYGGRAVLWNKRPRDHRDADQFPIPVSGVFQYDPAAAAAPLAQDMYRMSPPLHPHAVPAISNDNSSKVTYYISTIEREREREREQRQREREQRENRKCEREREEPPVSKPGLVQFVSGNRPPSHGQYQDKFHALRPATHVPIHGGVIPIQQPLQGAKTGSITSGYPVRSPAPPPSSTQHASPHASPQPPPRPSTTFQPAGPIIQPVLQPTIYPQPRFIPLTRPSDPPTSLGHLSHSVVLTQAHPPNHPATSHPSASHPATSHPVTSHATTYVPVLPGPIPSNHTPPQLIHVSSHPTGHTLSHSSPQILTHHSSHPSHVSSHPHPGSQNASHVVSHTSSHGSHSQHPIHSIGSVLHSSHQQGQQVQHRMNMSNMTRES